MANILETILKTVEQVQKKNKQSSREETADPSVFDLIREGVEQIKGKRNTSGTRGKSPKNVLDMIKDVVEKTRRKNKKDPDVATAPGSVFDKIKKKVEDKPKQEAQRGLKRIAEEYNLDISLIDPALVEDINLEYQDDMEALNKRYADAIFHFIKQSKRRK